MKRNLFDKIIKQNVMRSKPKINRDKIARDKLKDKIIRVFRHFLKQKKKIKERKKLEKKKEHNERLIKDGIIRDIRACFEKGEDYHELKRISKIITTSKMKIMVIKLSIDAYLT